MDTNYVSEFDGLNIIVVDGSVYNVEVIVCSNPEILEQDLCIYCDPEDRADVIGHYLETLTSELTKLEIKYELNSSFSDWRGGQFYGEGIVAYRQSEMRHEITTPNVSVSKIEDVEDYEISWYPVATNSADVDVERRIDILFNHAFHKAEEEANELAKRFHQKRNEAILAGE